jgi:glycine betaine transporter
MFAFTQTAFRKPAYSYFSWVLLYSTGMGSGLLLRAVQEPTYLNNPPIETANNKVTALQYTFFHWDLHHGQCIVYLV